MTPLTSKDIRDQFLQFFREKGHEIVPSAPLVPQDDPTLLFVNAGMNPFKDVFLGTGERPYNRAADTQKCLRVSGKHNDLEEVGIDTYHHTLFEMLGNWSFGDYFKREAIRWAWELLVEKWGLEPDRLYATVHEGDDALGLEADEEAAGFWKSETSIHPEHILYGASKDNFWMMGDTGPCGPCSEVHIDLRPDAEREQTSGADLVNTDDPRVMEIWNLVFIQYNASVEGEGGRGKGEEGRTRLVPLAAQHVDTGMGFERICAVLQGVTSTYDTDLFAPLLQKIADLSPLDEIGGYDRISGLPEPEVEKKRIAMRVACDHVRAVAFAIADGAAPGNVGRGYVIRRILRRAVRYGYQSLGLQEPFLYQLVAPLQEKMGETFPELAERQDYIERVIRSEEANFLETLGTGIGFFERILPHIKRLAVAEEQVTAGGDGVEDSLASLREDRQTLGLLEKSYIDTDSREAVLDRFSGAAARQEVPGEIAFLLHDTYGFPIDLTGLMAREEGLGVDMARYTELMQAQKTRARAAANFKIDAGEADVWRQVSEGEDSRFVGYDETEGTDVQVRAARTVQHEDDTEQHQLILNQTPFYAESGGQVGDTGTLRIGGEEVQVLDTQKEGEHIVHVVDHLPDNFDAPVTAAVDVQRRERIKKHHTATHLLHAALREVLGTHVQQKGSLVAPDRLRFDFSHFERVSPDELREIEARVNEVIQHNISKGEERHVPFEEAKRRGATALFGEKYGADVRVITFDPAYSVELCGGTHVGATGEIGLFRFLSEGSVAAGVRRVEAVAGQDALGEIDREIGELNRVRGLFKTLSRPVDEEVARLISERGQLEKELERVRQENFAAGLGALIEKAQQVGDVRLVTGRMDGLEMDALRTLGQTLRDRLGDRAVGVLGTVDPEGEKVYLVATVADDLVREKGLKAGALVGALAKRVGGGGGGRPELATAGGRQPEGLGAALDAVAEVLREQSGS